MAPSSFFSKTAQRWCVITTILLVQSALWLNAVESGSIKLPILVLGTSLFAAVFAGEGLRARHISLHMSDIDILVVLQFVLVVCSAFFQRDPLSTPGALQLAAAGFLMYLAGRHLFSNRRAGGMLFSILAYLTVVLCLVGLLQWFFAPGLPVDFHIGPDRRVSSLLGNSAFFASYLVLIFPIILTQALRRLALHRSTVLSWSLICAVGFLLVVTRTRSALAGAVVALIVVVLLSPRAGSTLRYRLPVFLTLIALIAGSLLTVRDTSSFNRRLPIWEAGVHAFLSSPILGYGTGGFEKAALEYRSPDYWQSGSEDVVRHAHNEILEIAVDHGIVGLVLVLVTLVALARRMVRRPDRNDWVLVGLVASLAGIATDNAAGVSLREAPIAALAWLFLGILVSRVAPRDGARSASPSIPWPVALAFVPPLLWALLAPGYIHGESLALRSDIHTLQGMKESETSPHTAIRELEEAVSLNSHNLLARSYLAMSFLRDRQWASVLRETQALQSLSPAYPKSSLMEAYALLRMGRYADALKAVDVELVRRSHPEAYLLQAGIYQALRDSTSERRSIRNLLRKDIEARLSFEIRPSCERLRRISTTDADRRDDAALFDSLDRMKELSIGP